MPKLWTHTIEAHRQAVRDATLDATAKLAMKHGLPAVTMSLVAEETGIGRATLYKYFPDVEAILVAWHERQITRHLAEIEKATGGVSGATARVTAALASYGRMVHAHHGSGFAAALHRRPHAQEAERRLHQFVSILIADAAAAGEMRADVDANELAHFALAGLAAASRLRSDGAVQRLVSVILRGLGAPASAGP